MLSPRTWKPGSRTEAKSAESSAPDGVPATSASRIFVTSVSSSTPIIASRRCTATRSDSMSPASSTGCPSPSQITAAALLSVAATTSSNSATWGSRAIAPWRVRVMLPATHSTRPTSLESATAPAAAPVGGYGVLENCVRSRASCAARSSAAARSSSPRAWVSATRATASTAADNRRRRLSCHGGGQTSRQAGMAMAPASSQPTRRGPMADGGSATATGRTKVSRAAVAQVAIWGATMPAKRTRNPTTAMATTASTWWVDTAVPSAMKPQATANSTT